MDKLIQQLRVALAIHGIAAWVVALMCGGVLLQLMVWGILYLTTGVPGPGYATFLGMVSLPADFSHLLYKPWTLITYPWFAPGGNLVFYALMAGLFLWAFAKIHQQLLGDAHTRRLVLMAVPLTGALTVLVASLLGIGSNAYVSGIYPLAATLMVSAVALVPNYPIELVLIGQVRLWIVGAVALVVLLYGSGQPFSPGWLSLSWGAVLGALHILMLKRYGTDVPLWIGNRLSSLRSAPAQKPSPRPREQVRTAAYRDSSRTQSSPRQDAPIIDLPIPQEVIDQILDKINATGYDSLTKKEKELLFKASNQQE